MTQLYVGNLSEEGDEKSIRALFGKYGTVREVLMKNGYAFVEMESPQQAEHVMRVLNGTDILGHPMIVEPSHQQRLTRRSQLGVVEVTNIPTHMTLEAIENHFNQTVGQVMKLEIEDNQPSDFGAKRVLISFESMEIAHRAAAMYSNDESALKCTVLGEYYRPGSAGALKNGRKSIPASPTKGNNEFPLRILVPSEMVGAIIGKDGATIRHITQLTKARVDVHRRENLGSMEKAITIIGGPESCTEACYQIMRIMQNELLTTNGSIFENGKHHFEPLPVVPLKVLAHNELVGRVIGKGGNTLKRIMAESGTKITISKLKDLTAYNMERTITILGTIDNCKKAESLISAKLRASYESDMSQFMLSSDNSPTSSPPHSSLGNDTFTKSSIIHPQSLPTTPTAVRTFQDYSQEHTRLTTLHGSTGALEVNGLGGFYHPNGAGIVGTTHASNNKQPPHYGSQYLPHSQIDHLTNGGISNGYGNHKSYHFSGHTAGEMGCGNGSRSSSLSGYPDDDDLTDVFQGLSLKEPPGIGYRRTSNIMSSISRRSSAPTQSGLTPGWPSSISEEEDPILPINSGHRTMQGSKFIGMWPTPQQPNTSTNNFLPQSTTNNFLPQSSTNNYLPQSSTNNYLPQSSTNQGAAPGSIWSPSFGSRPESELSNYHDSDSSNNGFSPIYSPVTTVSTTSGIFEPPSMLPHHSSSAFHSSASSSNSTVIDSMSQTKPTPLTSFIGPDHTSDLYTKSHSIGCTFNGEEDDSFLDNLIKDPVNAVTSSVW